MINQSISIVTTFHKAGLDKYAQKMLDSFAETWPKEITLWQLSERSPSIGAKKLPKVYKRELKSRSAVDNKRRPIKSHQNLGGKK